MYMGKQCVSHKTEKLFLAICGILKRTSVTVNTLSIKFTRKYEYQLLL